MRFLEFPPKAPPGSPFCHCDILRRARGFGPSHCPVGYWAPPSDFGLLPVKGRGEKVVLELWEGGREGGMPRDPCAAVWVALMGVSVPSGWPGAVCAADAHPHPDHRVCS